MNTTIKEYTDKWRELMQGYETDPDMPEEMRDQHTMKFNAAKKKLLLDAEDFFMSAWYALNREYETNEKSAQLAEYEKRKLIRAGKLTEADTTPDIEKTKAVKIDLCDKAMELIKTTKRIEVLMSVSSWSFYPEIFYKLTSEYYRL